jgi:deoxycytidylate deaminase
MLSYYTMKVRDMIHECVELSKRSDFPTFRHGSIIVHKNKILSVGFNIHSERYLYMGTRYMASCHAEMMSLDHFSCKRSLLKDSTLVVIRTNRDNRVSNSKPCSVCMARIQASGIRKVIYSASPDTVGIIWLG